ncbi:hypothetical protein McanMca71_006512 [Microsporum canis]|uniref:Uncharacterized protein n=1 Tax=Arthroderma otae (strain ATCC MYA-4605 / CBS 113480) TaxID=554155 RepID=C5FTQ6_ARTOC|nr:conserved hypothetical protein [Microsporum canis CBS 113480]EEQ33259.1 conserved hypothetical protein [Microsporum canis CBS 113480]
MALAESFLQGFSTLHNSIGYKKGYNFILWFIFAGALLGFTLARFSFLNFDIFEHDSVPGQWYFTRMGRDRVGLLLHLAAVLPCGILVIFQFIPIIRHKWILIHRINGYIIFILLLISHAGALMIMEHSFGGGVDIQSAVITVVIACTVSFCLALYNIRCKQLEQHRAWMLRTMFYMGCIITIRICLIISASILGALPHLRHDVWSCDQVQFTFMNGASDAVAASAKLAKLFPQCTAPDSASIMVPVPASLNLSNPASAGAAFNLSFGTAIWISFMLHALGVEIYLRLTPKEAERLRQISYERQLAAGFKNPGSAGLVVEKLGDADPWKGPV